MKNKIILASNSPYKRALLGKLGIPFTAVKPSFNEECYDKNPNHDHRELSLQLAYLKGESLVDGSSIVISADQLCSFENEILSKPGNHATAIKHLKKLQGKTHKLITSYCLFHSDGVIKRTDITTLTMKKMSDQEIEDYLKLDTPYDCAGAYKIEEAGIALFDNILCDDFTAIMGLPLIQLSQDLKSLGVELWKPL
ncbi:MAG: septum formation protein Maf [Halobacteriovoraceae bacterium]|nr:septum formation protein Maf [Halobacteriovoraceae bacterium]MCB9095499.1 septum formation protein Maf [Halobacteriovoraceae bacterium]